MEKSNRNMLIGVQSILKQKNGDEIMTTEKIRKEKLRQASESLGQCSLDDFAVREVDLDLR